MFVTSQSTKVLDDPQNYLFDFYLRPTSCAVDPMTKRCNATIFPEDRPDDRMLDQVSLRQDTDYLNRLARTLVERQTPYQEDMSSDP